jgi:hypothetical protein
MVFEGLVGLGLAFLLAPAIAEFAKIRHKAEKGFSFMALAGASFLFAASFDMLPLISEQGAYLQVIQMGGLIFQGIGWLSALVGWAFIMYEMLLEK